MINLIKYWQSKVKLSNWKIYNIILYNLLNFELLLTVVSMKDGMIYNNMFTEFINIFNPIKINIDLSFIIYYYTFFW